MSSRTQCASGWHLFYFKTFKTVLDELELAVGKLARQDPGGYKAHPKARLLASVYKAITQSVPADPGHLDFRLGETLGGEHTNWRRVKKGMPDRYRLFFRFSSMPIKLIVYVWFNDEDTLRKAGSKTDVCEVFKRMLSRGQVPRSINELMAESTRGAS